MRCRSLAASFLLAAASILLTAGADADDAADPLAQSQKILDAQLKALSDVLSPELQQELKASQQSWAAYRDQQCAYELKFAQEQGQRRVKEAGGRDINCVNRFNQQRMQQLQQNMNTLMQLQSRPTLNEGMNEGNYLPKACRLTDLPSAFEIHAVGIYAGTAQADAKLGNSGHEARSATVVVNKPGVPVVLVLMAYDPVVWQVSRTKDTTIAAVLVGSYHKQAVLGIDKATPVHLYSYEERAGCGYFQAFRADRGLTAANERIKALTGQDMMDLVTEPTEGRFVVGSAAGIDQANLVTSMDRKLEDYGAIAMPTGMRGIDALIREGKLRQATKDDIDAFVAKASEPYRKLNPALTVKVPAIPIERSYVALAPVDLPPALGNTLVVVPDGVPAPTNVRGTVLLLMSTGQCLIRGTLECPQD